MRFDELVLAALPLLLGVASGLCTASGMGWYNSLQKPKWAPPKWVYAPVWTALYLLLGVVSLRLEPRLLTWYYAHLALNFAWSPVFFGLRKPPAAMAILVAMLGIIVYVFACTEDTTARLALAPYIAWLVFAGALNLSIVRLQSRPKEQPVDSSIYTHQPM
jgi:tryptophan-rich sensory protein